MYIMHLGAFLNIKNAPSVTFVVTRSNHARQPALPVLTRCLGRASFPTPTQKGNRSQSPPQFRLHSSFMLPVSHRLPVRALRHRRVCLICRAIEGGSRPRQSLEFLRDPYMEKWCSGHQHTAVLRIRSRASWSRASPHCRAPLFQPLRDQSSPTPSIPSPPIIHLAFPNL
jgi:hypothetical protein